MHNPAVEILYYQARCAVEILDNISLMPMSVKPSCKAAAPKIDAYSQQEQ
jgi:hypothetical protein